MTDEIFFDTDCICAFLWVNNESLLAKMYPAKIMIPQEVYDEIDKPMISHLKNRMDQLITGGFAKVISMDIGTKEYSLYRELTTFSGNNKVIGRGEAAAIALAQKCNGVVGSNNLRDITEYIHLFSLRHKTTGDLLVEAWEKKLITEKQGNQIWADMLKKEESSERILLRNFCEKR